MMVRKEEGMAERAGKRLRERSPESRRNPRFVPTKERYSSYHDEVQDDSEDEKGGIRPLLRR